jgi:hypothetical protein
MFCITANHRVVRVVSVHFEDAYYLKLLPRFVLVVRLSRRTRDLALGVRYPFRCLPSRAAVS